AVAFPGGVAAIADTEEGAESRARVDRQIRALFDESVAVLVAGDLENGHLDEVALPEARVTVVENDPVRVSAGGRRRGPGELDAQDRVRPDVTGQVEALPVHNAGAPHLVPVAAVGLPGGVAAVADT